MTAAPSPGGDDPPGLPARPVPGPGGGPGALLSLAGRAALAGLATAGATAYVVERRLPSPVRPASSDPALALPPDVEHREVTVSDGGRVHVLERGEGRPLVLVPGVGLHGAIWVRQLHQLAGRYRVLVVDQRGHGQSLAGSGGYLFDRLAEDLVEVVAALGASGALVVGHSMGGMVAQLAALDHRERLAGHVAGLALVATASDVALPGPLRLWARAATVPTGAALRLAGARGWRLLPGSDLAAWTARFSFGARPRPADLELAAAMIAAMDPAALAGLVEGAFGYSTTRRLGAIDLPTAVVVGTHDLLTPPRTAQVLADGIPGATVTQLAGCGHMVMLERPDELAAAVDRLAARAAGEAGSPGEPAERPAAGSAA